MFLKKHTLETREKMSKAMTGIKRSAQGSINIGNSKRGLKLSEEHKRKLSEASKGRPKSIETRKRMSEGRKKIMTPEFRKQLSNANKGSKSYNWKGGITSSNEIIRHSVEYRLWRTAVFERDGYQCIWGGKAHGNRLQADHIKSFAQFPELRFAIDNGRTLCIPCHKTTETYARHT